MTLHARSRASRCARAGDERGAMPGQAAGNDARAIERAVHGRACSSTLMVTAQTLVERSLRAYRERVAVVDGERQLSYGDIDARSARLGNALLALGCSHERPVAILL